VLSNERYGARLQAFGAFGLQCDKTYLVAHCDLVERPARDAVAVEINFTAVGGRDEPVVFPSGKGGLCDCDRAPYGA